MAAKVIEEIVKNDICIGCGICVGICPHDSIKINFNAWGEYNPYQIIDNQCVDNCHQCLNVCPFFDLNKDEDAISKYLFSEVNNIKYLSDTGYYLNSFIGFSASNGHRERGASGGMATWMLEKLISKDIVDYVVCVTTNEDPDKLFKVIISNDIDLIRSSAGSAYYPIEMSEAIREIINRPGRYAIIGLPCFLKAIRLAAERNSKLKNSIIVLMGLVCGQLKNKQFTKYIYSLAGGEGRPNKVLYRGKGNNRTSNYYFNFINEMGIISKIYWNQGIEDVWHNRWFTHNACNFCDDVFAEVADISFMDAWLPEYSEDTMGTSLMIIRSPILGQLIEEGVSNGEIVVKEIAIEKAIASQLGVINIKKNYLPYRSRISIDSGSKLPDKRWRKDETSFFEKKIIKNKFIMQNKSKLIFENYYLNYNFNIKSFDDEMAPYIKRIRFWNRLINLSSFYTKVIYLIKILRRHSNDK